MLVCYVLLVRGVSCTAARTRATAARVLVMGWCRREADGRSEERLPQSGRCEPGAEPEHQVLPGAGEEEQADDNQKATADAQDGPSAATSPGGHPDRPARAQCHCYERIAETEAVGQREHGSTEGRPATRFSPGAH